MKINEMKAEDKPMERCKLYGPGALSDAELLAIILCTGTKGCSVLELAAALLERDGPYDGLTAVIQSDWQELAAVRGIGASKALKLCVIGEISRRMWQRKRRCVSSSFLSAQAVTEFFKEDLRYLEHEEIHLLLLDSRMQLLRTSRISVGTCNQSLTSVREILMQALRANASALILVHNHPGGDPRPSPEDRHFTESLAEGGELVGLQLVDHVVIGDNQYFSFKEQGLI